MAVKRDTQNMKERNRKKLKESDRAKEKERERDSEEKKLSGVSNNLVGPETRKCAIDSTCFFV